VALDVTGWFGPAGSGTYRAVAPVRVVDSRVAQGVPARLPRGVDTSFTVAGRGGIPTTGAIAFMATLTVLGVDEVGGITIHPCRTPAPPAGRDVGSVRTLVRRHAATAALVGASAAGGWCARPVADQHLVVDVVGWFG
jgi:hypothetical protein